MALLPWLAGCVADKADTAGLRTGDLLFQVSGTSDFAEAITSTTAAADTLRFDHVAAVTVGADGSVNVIEASPQGGVRQIPLADFLETSTKINGKPGVVVKRLETDCLPADDIAHRLQACIGQPYDWWYLSDNGKMYCSELIAECYLDPDGTPYFAPSPMTFRDSDGNTPRFWVDLFRELGMDVPEGVPGTNPADMARTPTLREVYRFF